MPEETMFCDGCGTAVQVGQEFCGRCGKQIVGTLTKMPERRSRVQEHIHLVGIFWLALSAYDVIGGVAAYIVGNTIFARGNHTGAPTFLHPLLSAIGLMILGKAALGFVAGWGLLRRESWARTLALVLSFIALFSVPFGTAVGVYTLWVLLAGDSEQEYEYIADARAA
jgi:hypothetical protein